MKRENGTYNMKIYSNVVQKEKNVLEYIRGSEI